jgi:hypothetical protein
MESGTYDIYLAGSEKGWGGDPHHGELEGSALFGELVDGCIDGN